MSTMPFLIAFTARCAEAIAVPHMVISEEIDRLAENILHSRQSAPDDVAALCARQELWLARERLRSQLNRLTGRDA